MKRFKRFSIFSLLILSALLWFSISLVTDTNMTFQAVYANDLNASSSPLSPKDFSEPTVQVPSATPLATSYPVEQLLSLRERLVESVTRALAESSTGVRLLDLEFNGHTLTLNFSSEANRLVDSYAFEELMRRINHSVNALFDEEGWSEHSFEYFILIDGKPLFDPQPPVATSRVLNTIQGKKIVLSPGHGWYETTSGGWSLQRGYHWGIVEDFINADLVIELNSMLVSNGADTYPTRQLDKNAGNHSSGHPWWEMDASEYVRSIGAPWSVWHGGLNDTDRDVASRPEYANWIGADAMISIHNNGYNGVDGCGTEIWYDNSNGYQSQSLELANTIHNKLIQRLQAEWDPNWCDRGVKGSNFYGENRRFNGPAVIVELAFMDIYSDNQALQDATFRSIATTAIGNAIVEYFGGSSNSGSIGGSVSDISNEPVSGALVTFTGGGTTLETTSNEQGFYEFLSVPVGAATITARRGDEEGSVSVTVQANQTVGAPNIQFQCAPPNCGEQPRDDVVASTGHFSDVGFDNIFFRYIETLYHIGAVDRDGTYGPSEEVTRDEVAKIIILTLDEYVEYQDGQCAFNDVCPGHEFYHYIRRMKELGITEGYGDGTYHPNEEMNRASLAKFLVMAHDGEEPSYSSCSEPFLDVSCTEFFYPYVRRLKEIFDAKEIGLGYSNGTYYQPHELTTREMIAKLAVVGLDKEDLVPTFPDVLHDNFWYTYIEGIADRGLTDGYSDGTFKPDVVLTRGGAAKFIIRGLGEEPHYDDCVQPFPDVQCDHIFYPYIRRLKERGITDGYSDRTYKPDEGITRAAIAKFIIRALGEEREYTDGLEVFPDVSVGHPFYHDIRRLKELNITNGYGNDTYRPDPCNIQSDEDEDKYGCLTRGASAKFMYLAFVQRTPQGVDTQEPTDDANNNPFTAPLYTEWVKYVVPGINLDQDWIKFPVTVAARGSANTAYRLTTNYPGLNADIRIEVYSDPNGTPLATAEGEASDGGTSLLWTPQSSGTYYVRLTNSNPFAEYGTQLYFTAETTSLSQALYLPLITRSSSSNPPTLSPTATQSSDSPTLTPTATPTQGSTPPTETPTPTPTPTNTPTNTPTLTPTPIACTEHFPDVSSDHPFFPYIEALYEIGAADGYSDGTYRPDENATRGAVAKITILALDEYVEYQDGQCAFSDVCPGHPFYHYIRRMKDLGITNGYSDGTYRPDDYLSRAALAKFVVIAADGEEPSYSSCSQPFPDVSCEYLFYPHIRRLKEIFDAKGFGLGYSDGTFRPDDMITRGGMAKLTVIGLDREDSIPICP